MGTVLPLFAAPSLVQPTNWCQLGFDELAVFNARVNRLLNPDLAGTVETKKGRMLLGMRLREVANG